MADTTPNSSKSSSFIEEDDVGLDLEFETTEEIPVPFRLVDQVIGQDEGVEIIKKASVQRRNVLLIGDPGTGKSMLGQALAELLPKEEMEDILCLPNPMDTQSPRIMTVPALEGRRIVAHYREQARKADRVRNLFILAILGIILIIGALNGVQTFLTALLIVVLAFFILGQFRSRKDNMVPKLLVDNTDSVSSPFFDGTGAHAGALLGDVRHDPFQSGGLGTPAHHRVEAGLIHKGHRGVLYVDEIATLKQKTQQQLLTAMQDKKLSVTGQSELSSGAMVRTEPVPCDFVLCASGNVETVRRMHPALRSRIRGYGYEVFINHHIPDTIENRRKLTRFIAQEITKDGKIPHFTREAVLEVIREAKRRAGRKNRLTLRLRDLGGLIRAAGDIAREKNVQYTLPEHIMDAKNLARSLEHQIADRYVEQKKEYQVIQTTGAVVGKVNGLSVMSDPTGGARAGSVMPIEAQVTPAQGRGGRTIATGKLRIIARESVQNVSALIKTWTGRDIANHDVHIQFLGTHEGVEGDSASITIATAVISDIEDLPVRQEIAMTGSLSVRGEVLPVGGVTAKIEGAAAIGIREIIIPRANAEDVTLETHLKEDGILIHPVSSLQEVLAIALVGWDKKRKEHFTKHTQKIDSSTGLVPRRSPVPG